jgi:hypothetical protein
MDDYEVNIQQKKRMPQQVGSQESDSKGDKQQNKGSE